MWFIKASEEQQQNKDTHFAADRHSFTRDALFPDPIIQCIYFSTRKQTNKTIAVVGNGTSQIILFLKWILAFLSCLCHSRSKKRQAFHPISEFTKSIPGRNSHPYKVHTIPFFRSTAAYGGRISRLMMMISNSFSSTNNHHKGNRSINKETLAIG